MDPGFLNTICLTFRDTFLPIAPQLVDILHPTWFAFVKLAVIIMLAGMMFGASGMVLSGLFIGTLGIGFTHVLLLFSWQWASDFFSGAVQLSERLGASAPNPSAILSLGIEASRPLLTSVADQGLLSYVRHPTSIIFALAGVFVLAAFAILAFVQMAFLLWSYVLVAVAPFMCLFAVIPILNGLTMSWARQALGTTAGLFVVGLICIAAQRIGADMATSYAAAYGNPGVTLGVEDYLHPLVVGFILATVFGWVPVRFSREAAAVGADILRGAGALVMGGGAGVSAASSAVSIPSSGSGSSHPTGGGGGGGSSSSGGGGGGGRGMGPAQQPAKSAWGS